MVSAITFNYFKSGLIRTISKVLERGYPLSRDNERFNYDEISTAMKWRGDRQGGERKKKEEGKRWRERLINTGKGVASKNIIYYCVPRTRRNGFSNADNVHEIIRVLLV